MLERSLSNLRPLTRADLELVREWRNSDRIRSVMYTDQLITASAQEDWFKKISSDPTSFYFLFEYDRVPIGMIYFNDFDKKSSRLTWGFYKGNIKAPPGSALAMGFLGLDFVFGNIKINEVHGETFVFNKPGIQYHLKLGFTDLGQLKTSIYKSGHLQDVCVFRLLKDDWLRKKKILERSLFYMENPS